jgi:hypothetical protein
MPKVPVTCQECGNEFEIFPSRLKRGQVKYCSKTCMIKAQSKKTGENNPSWKGGKITRVCKECGKEFKKHPSGTKNGQGQYCSKACMGKALSAYKTRICDVCRKEFKTNEPTQKYCSRTCMGKAQSKIYIGEKHHNWRGGVSFEPYCSKFNNEFKERVRTFFNNVCILCGKTEQENGKKLIVHHVNYKKEACCDEDIPRVFVILCASCHGKTNSVKGREKYQKQFEKMIEKRFGGRSYFHKKEQLSHYGVR